MTEWMSASGQNRNALCDAAGLVRVIEVGIMRTLRNAQKEGAGSMYAIPGGLKRRHVLII